MVEAGVATAGDGWELGGVMFASPTPATGCRGKREERREHTAPVLDLGTSGKEVAGVARSERRRPHAHWATSTAARAICFSAVEPGGLITLILHDTLVRLPL